MILKKIQLALFYMFCLVITNTTLAQDKSAATAKQVVEKFQSELITVMKNGKQLGYSGRYNNLTKPISDSHDLTKIARIIVGKEWEKLSEAQQ
ncbi:MAG: hopanoid biosynthesis protein HpnM, partial [Methylococcaceae bacterium]